MIVRFSFILGIMLSLLVISSIASVQVQSSIKPLSEAHAHNDYHHQRPLLDALDRGFCSVEADIYLVDGQLLVAHTPLELFKARTLEKLYLAPLKQRVQKNDGRVYANGHVFMLLIDIKANGTDVYKVLRRVLAKYKDMLCSVENGKFRDAAVQVVISGDCPRQFIREDSPRYAGIDGRPGDLNSKAPAHLIPLISDRWSAQFRWRGDGDFPTAERDTLRLIVQTAHASRRRVRFWATPEEPELWRELRAANVDHINTDDLDALRDFLLHE